MNLFRILSLVLMMSWLTGCGGGGGATTIREVLGLATLSGTAGAGKVVGPSFSAAEVTEVIEAVIHKYLELRAPSSSNGRAEYFIETLNRVGQEAFKVAANSARHPAKEFA
jgi:sulfite reductase beta subunit-like hemoprotein